LLVIVAVLCCARSPESDKYPYLSFTLTLHFHVMENFSFDEWLSDVGLSENGVKCIVRAELTDLKALLLVNVSDVLDELKLSLGDRGKLKYNLEALKAEHSELYTPVKIAKQVKPPPEREDLKKSDLGSGAGNENEQKYSIVEVTALLESQRLNLQDPDQTGLKNVESAALNSLPGRRPPFLGQVTTRSLARDSQLSRRAKAYAGPLVSDLLATNDSSTDKTRGEKPPFLPCNFVSYLRGQHPDEESIVQSVNGTDLILRDNLKRPSPDKITTGQYTEASHRILRLLAPTLSEDEFDEYLEYMCQVGILLQTFTVGSVFALDHLHRQDVHYKGRLWDNINQTLQIAILKKKDDASNFISSQKNVRKVPSIQPARQSSVSAVMSGSNSSIPCWHYNQQDKVCRFNPCKFPHICSVENCKGNHPAFRHVYPNQATPSSDGNFRPQITQK
jgi:hypothetical protein